MTELGASDHSCTNVRADWYLIARIAKRPPDLDALTARSASADGAEDWRHVDRNKATNACER